MGGRIWTPAEDAQIRSAMGHFGALAAVGRRIDRSPGAVRVRAHALRRAPQGIEHDRTAAPYPDDPCTPAPVPPGISAEEFERRVNEQVRSLLTPRRLFTIRMRAITALLGRRTSDTPQVIQPDVVEHCTPGQ